MAKRVGRKTLSAESVKQNDEAQETRNEDESEDPSEACG